MGQKLVVKTNMSSPKNIKLNNNTWDSITLSWDVVENTSKELIIYKVEMKKEKEVVEVFSMIETKFTKRGLLADTEYNFRVQTMRGDELGVWNNAIKMRTPKVPVPSNISVNDVAWDSITLLWDTVENTSKEPIKYRVEMKKDEGENENDFIEVYNGTEAKFTKEGLLADTEYNFRIQTMRGDELGEWSNIAKGKTLKAPDLLGCAWKKCPDYVYEKLMYSVDVNSELQQR